MGVPAFFKWLTLRYPKVVMDAIEEINSDFDINSFLKNKYNSHTAMPYIDNLYLDMNGIIHPCCHPQDRAQPESEQEMFNSVFDYIDKLMKIIKPKQVVYLAVDGVAPRAKMNQQRSRRFRAAQEAKEKKMTEKELLEDWKDKGLKSPEMKAEGFDSNTITPGTTFMDRLAQAIKIYISHRMQFDILWKGLTVIFSDSNVPGEGEHKILEFIRSQRLQDHYDPNTKHCIYGADADLIMLSLITHEPHFFIIRESLNDNMWKKCEFCNKNGHTKEECKKLLNPADVTIEDTTSLINAIEFSIIKVHIVREYLELEFRNIKLAFEIESHMKYERFIDDFVFLCFFVGNDFIPHLPSLKIREGAIDALLYLYKKIIPSLDGFLTEGNGQINLKRTEILLEKLSLVEDEIFKKQLFFKNRELQRNAQRAIEQGRLDRSQFNNEVVREYFELQKPCKENESSNNEEIQLFDDIINDIEKVINKTEQDEIEEIKRQKLSQQAADNFQKVLKEVIKKEGMKKMENYEDKVKLGEDGWKDRYYKDKFKVSKDDHEFKELIKKSYIEGICWVFSYYYNGCLSWEWYYPFHYAPFASDLCNIKDMEIKFKLGVPYQPFEQLLSVLPPYSSEALPKCLQDLMHNPDSPLSDFYPNSIKLDINGQAFAWMGVNLIPFIDEHRIRKAVAERAQLLNEEEKYRNRFGETLVYFHFKNHFFAKHTVGFNYQTEDYYTYISSPSFRSFSGKLKSIDIHTQKPGTTLKSKIKGLKIKEVNKCEIVYMVFENPPVQNHISKLNKGVELPPKVVVEDNLEAYSKRNFKGDEAIGIVRRTLGFDQEEYEQEVRGQLFDNTFNNNRAIEYDPYMMDMLRKKRHKETSVEDKSRGDNNELSIGDNIRDDNRRYDNRRYDNRRDDNRRDDYRSNDNKWGNYRRDDSRRDNYGRDNYGRDNYRRDNYGRDNYGRDNYRRDNYGRDNCASDNLKKNYDSTYNQNFNYNHHKNNLNKNDINNATNDVTNTTTNNIELVNNNFKINQFNDPNLKANINKFSNQITPLQFDSIIDNTSSVNQDNSKRDSSNSSFNDSAANFSNILKAFEKYQGINSNTKK